MFVHKQTKTITDQDGNKLGTETVEHKFYPRLPSWIIPNLKLPQFKLQSPIVGVEDKNGSDVES